MADRNQHKHFYLAYLYHLRMSRPRGLTDFCMEMGWKYAQYDGKTGMCVCILQGQVTTQDGSMLTVRDFKLVSSAMFYV